MMRRQERTKTFALLSTSLFLMTGAAYGSPYKNVMTNDVPAALKTVGQAGAAGPKNAKVLDAALDSNGDIYVVSVVRPFGKINDFHRFYEYKYDQLGKNWTQVKSWKACSAESVDSTASDVALARNGDVWMIAGTWIGDRCTESGRNLILKNGMPDDLGLPEELDIKAIALNDDASSLSIVGTHDQKMEAYRYAAQDNQLTKDGVVKDYSNLGGMVSVKAHITSTDPLMVFYMINNARGNVFNTIAKKDTPSSNFYEPKGNIFTPEDLQGKPVGNIFSFYDPDYATDIFALAWNPVRLLPKMALQYNVPFYTMPIQDVPRTPSSSNHAVTMAAASSLAFEKGKSAYLAYVSLDKMYMYTKTDNNNWQPTAFVGDLNGTRTDGVKLFDEPGYGKKRLFVAYNEPGSGITVKVAFDNSSLP